MLFAQWGRNLAPLAANLEHFAQDLQLNSTPIAPGSTTPPDDMNTTKASLAAAIFQRGR